MSKCVIVVFERLRHWDYLLSEYNKFPKIAILKILYFKVNVTEKLLIKAKQKALVNIHLLR